MSSTRSDLTARTHHSGNAANSLDSVSLPGPGIEPELKVINDETLSAQRYDARPKHIEEIFATQKWHKLYADALMEGDSCKIATVIASAERAIFNRYLELWAAKDQSDERVDLGRAVEALRELEDAANTAPIYKP
jgi:predicted phage gp36 major capsid-like protein